MYAYQKIFNLNPILSENQNDFVPTWLTEKIEQEETNVYINEMISSPITLNLTFQKMYKSFNNEITPFDKWIDSIGIVLVNVDEASLRLKGFKMQ